MIKPEQIPDEAIKKAIKAYDDADGQQDRWMREAIAAAINAWPGALQEEGVFTMDDDCMILPLPKGKKND